MPHQLGPWQGRLDAGGLPEHPDPMRHDQNPPRLDKNIGLDKKSKRKEREDRLAASLRQNLLRRKAQARARRDGEARDSQAQGRKAGNNEAEPPTVDLEVEAIVPDTGAATKAGR